MAGVDHHSLYRPQIGALCSHENFHELFMKTIATAQSQINPVNLATEDNCTGTGSQISVQRMKIGLKNHGVQDGSMEGLKICDSESVLSVIVDVEMQFPAFCVISLSFLALPVADFQDLTIGLYISNPFSLLVSPIREQLAIPPLRHS
jgi:hypothetical protein